MNQSKNCPVCNTTTESNSNYCGHCGYSFATGIEVKSEQCLNVTHKRRGIIYTIAALVGINAFFAQGCDTTCDECTPVCDLQC